MKDLLNEINDRFPVRNSGDEKAAFRAWAAERARKAGHTVREENSSGHVNLVIGDPDRAEVIFTAHCDTPRRSIHPNLMIPVCAPLRYAYMFAIIVPIFAVSIFGGWLARSRSRWKNTSSGPIFPRRSSRRTASGRSYPTR